MSSQIYENPFVISKDEETCPRTPTLPCIQDNSKQRNSSFRQKNLKIITTGQKNTASPAIKSNRYRLMSYIDTPIRKNLQNEYEKFNEPFSAVTNQNVRKNFSAKGPERSLSSSVKEKNLNYLTEIYKLNTKIRNLIKEQDTLKDKLLVQENILMNLHKDYEIKPPVPFHEIQSATIPRFENNSGSIHLEEIKSATIPKNESFDESFQVTFKPMEKWLQPVSRRFPRDVFCKITKNRLSY